MWPSILASIVFSCATYAMLGLYSTVHWQIMLNKGRPRNGDLLEHVYPVLTQLAWLRIIFAVLALTWAIWSFTGRPRSASIAALALAVFAAMTNLIIM